LRAAVLVGAGAAASSAGGNKNSPIRCIHDPPLEELSEELPPKRPETAFSQLEPLGFAGPTGGGLNPRALAELLEELGVGELEKEETEDAIDTYTCSFGRPLAKPS